MNLTERHILSVDVSQFFLKKGLTYRLMFVILHIEQIKHIKQSSGGMTYVNA